MTGGATTEVVTHARVRDVRLPYGAGTLALVTLDNDRDHTRPTTLGPVGLAEFGETLQTLAARARAGEIAAVAVTGKPFVFAVGADLTVLRGSLGTREQGLHLARTGHAVLGRLGELGVPSFAYVNGPALGGGFEIALNCTYRTVAGSAAGLGLPECSLGLIPGWGGAWLLPRLVGPAAALDVIVRNPLSQNRTLRAAQLRELGIADEIFDAADFLESSIAWTARVLTGRVEVSRPAVDLTDAAAWEAEVERARTFVDERLHGAAPAPYLALDLVAGARTRDRAAGFAAEDEALAELAVSPELRAGLYSFDLVNKRARRPAGAPDPALARPVTAVGVVGAGLMATQLALVFARRLEVPVVMTDLDQGRVDAGLARVRGEIRRLVEKGRVSPDVGNRLEALITGSVHVSDLARADLVIEAVFEDLEVKRQVFAQVEGVVSADCVLMSNTSSLSITEMSADLKHPERVVGFHFFNPVAVMPLVEIVRGSTTDEATLATAFAVGRQLRKSCVLVKDAAGFVVNRLLLRFMCEVFAMVDAGTPPEVADRAPQRLGLPMTPFTLLELVGPAVALHVAETLNAAFGDRFAVSTTLQRMVAEGRRGLWSRDERGRPVLDDATRAMLEQTVTGSEVLDEEGVLRRIVDALAEEAGLMLDEGVVAAAEDLDLCMILGAGWPFHLGGITPYLDRTGVSERVRGRTLHT